MQSCTMANTCRSYGAMAGVYILAINIMLLRSMKQETVASSQKNVPNDEKTLTGTYVVRYN
jgi:hypothetical protein